MKTHLGSPTVEPAGAGVVQADRPGRHSTAAFRKRGYTAYTLLPFLIAIALVTSCSPPVEKPRGAAAIYDNAKQTFAKGHYDKALEVLDDLNDADPPNAYTDRARVLSAIILSGEVNGYKEVADAYAKGAEKTKDRNDKVEFSRQRTDNILRCSKLALGLGQVTMQLTKGGTLPKELMLEAPYPTSESPVSMPVLNKVRDGLKIGRDDEEQVELDAPRVGVADAIAEALRTDRDKAKSKMNAGPINLDKGDFALYLSNAVLTAASIYDPKHGNDPAKFKTLADIASGSMNIAATSLRSDSDPAKTKRLKTLQAQLKDSDKTLKNWMTLLRR